MSISAEQRRSLYPCPLCQTSEAHLAVLHLRSALKRFIDRNMKINPTVLLISGEKKYNT